MADSALDLLTTPLDDLMAEARRLREDGTGKLVTYSPKVFIPLTTLCRDVCGYCTFARPPRRGERAYLSEDEVLAIARAGAEAGCTEALFTLGDRPEARYRVAREELEALGCETTLEYLARCAGRVLAETGLLPHLNPGVMSRDELVALRPVAASMGIMLETTAERLAARGGPHWASPDKVPARRLETMRLAGELSIPFTSGILVGIGETREERLEALVALRELASEHGHLREVIVQNFRAKPETRMAAPPGRVARGASLVGRGRPDRARAGHSRPGATEPRLRGLSAAARRGDRRLGRRLAGHPRSRESRGAVAGGRAPASSVRGARARARTTPASLPRARRRPRPLGRSGRSPGDQARRRTRTASRGRIVGHPASRARCRSSSAVIRRRSRSSASELGEAELVRLFATRGAERERVFAAADRLRREVCGDEVTYVVTRNIQYTNVCYFRCGFCAFSKGKLAKNLRGPAYLVPDEEIARRVREAWERGATEVCLQGGIHPSFTGDYYADVVETVKAAAPEIHVHAFSALEIWQGAATLGLDLETYLERLRDLGLGSLPGTAAEVLDDEVRAIICPDKVTTGQWLAVHEAAHRVGLRSNVTIMFGHVERPVHWARHLLRARAQQERSGGFTELVPLPFVPMEAPIYLAGRARRGPTFGEALLLHAVARLALHPLITNVQASWVKLGPEGVRQALAAGVNDLGGTLMNESISRSAGSEWGQELPPEQMESLIRSAGRVPRQRTTIYGAPSERAGRPLVRRGAARRDDQPAGARRRVEASCPAPAAGRAAFLAPSPTRVEREGRQAQAARRGNPRRECARAPRRPVGRVGPVEPLAVPDEEVLGLEPLELRPRRREAEHEVHACALVSGAGRTGWCRSPRRRRASARRSHQSARSRQRGLARTTIVSNGVPGSSSGVTRWGTPSSAASSAQSRL